MSFLVELLIDFLGGAVVESMEETRSRKVRRRFEVLIGVLGVVALILCVYLGLAIGGGAGIVVGSCAWIAAVLLLAIFYGNFVQLMPPERDA